MSEIRFNSVEMLYLLWLVPALAGVLVYAARRRRRALDVFIGAGLLDKVRITAAGRRRAWKAAAFLAAFAFIVTALARPGWNPKPSTIERRGRDVVFVLDVSRSMLAEDLVPNRLERAKMAILDCIERLRGDRVALVVFAGTSVVKCPLTLDYGFFRMMTEDVSPDSVSRGGTVIGDAIRKTMDEVFDKRDREHKDVVLITDGEDHDSFPVKAAEDAGEQGIRIIAVGLGDESEGRRIPVLNERGDREFLKYRNSEVWSRLDADTLKKMALATPGGKYLPVRTGAVDLGDVYTKLIEPADKKTVESRTVKRYEERFQIFIGLAFVLLCAEMAVSERKRKA